MRVWGPSSAGDPPVELGPGLLERDGIGGARPGQRRPTRGRPPGRATRTLWVKRQKPSPETVVLETARNLAAGAISSYPAPMACPNCGGAERRAITPGYWECTTLLPVRAATGVPHPALGPMWTEGAVACLTRYQEGPKLLTPSCSRCGQYSVGRCDHCQRPYCGDHARSTSYGFQCLDGIAENNTRHRAEQAQEAARTQQEAAAAKDARDREHQAAVERNRSQHGPEEPILAAIDQLKPAAARAKTVIPGFLTLLVLMIVTPIATLIVGAAAAQGRTDIKPGPIIAAAMAAVATCWLIWFATALYLRARGRRAIVAIDRLTEELGCGERSCNTCYAFTPARPGALTYKKSKAA